MNNDIKNVVRLLTRSSYDFQDLRIEMGNRITGNFKAKLGQEPSASEDSLDKEAKKVLKLLRQSYDVITDGVVKMNRKKFKGDAVITEYAEFCLVEAYLEFVKRENANFRQLEACLDDHPLWSNYLQDVKGVGPKMAGSIISEIDITKAKYVSSIWKYCGLDVVKNKETNEGEGRSRKKHHLEDSEYTDKNGKAAVKKGITYNPKIKTKLMGVLAGSFLKSGNEKYARVYYDYKNRLENHSKHKEKTKGHRHAMALRYMIKIFLADLYREWRTLEGLEVHAPYEEAKLGIKHAA